MTDSELELDMQIEGMTSLILTEEPGRPRPRPRPRPRAIIPMPQTPDRPSKRRFESMPELTSESEFDEPTPKRQRVPQSISLTNSTINNIQALRQALTAAPGMVEGNEAPPEQLPVVYVPLLPLEGFPSEEEEPVGTFCFMCEHKQNSLLTQANPSVIKMLKWVDEEWPACRPITICRVVQTWYNNRMKQHSGQDRDWSVHMIYRHFTKHAPSAVVTNEQAMRSANAIVDLIESSGLIKLDDDGVTRKIDYQAMRFYTTARNNARTATTAAYNTRIGAK